MSKEEIVSLEGLIKVCVATNLIEDFTPRENAIDHIRQQLQRVQVESDQRFGENFFVFSEQELIEQFLHNPQKIKSFFYAMRMTSDSQILLLVWRIIQGAYIKIISIAYERKHDFEARVVLESDGDLSDDEYFTNNIYDFQIFRHLGVIVVDKKLPIFDGFYVPFED